MSERFTLSPRGRECACPLQALVQHRNIVQILLWNPNLEISVLSGNSPKAVGADVFTKEASITEHMRLSTGSSRTTRPRNA